MVTIERAPEKWATVLQVVREMTERDMPPCVEQRVLCRPTAERSPLLRPRVEKILKSNSY